MMVGDNSSTYFLEDLRQLGVVTPLPSNTSSLPNTTGLEAKDAANRIIRAITPGLVEELKKAKASISTWVEIEAAVQKEIEKQIPTLVATLQNEMQKTMSTLVDEIKNILIAYFFNSSQSISHTASLPRSPECLTVLEDPHSRILHLQFETPLPPIIFTKKNLSEICISPKVILLDESNKIVECSFKIRIVVISSDFPVDQNDWTEMEFNKHIIRGRKHKAYILDGTYKVSLINGVADIGDIHFIDNSSWQADKTFRLGALVEEGHSPGTRIREAVSGTIRVLECRGELNQKIEIPSVNEEVYCLHKIGRNGPIHNRLKNGNIHTVGDLLNVHSQNPTFLQSIIGSKKRVREIIKHAELARPTNQPNPGDSKRVRVTLETNEADYFGSSEWASGIMNSSYENPNNTVGVHMFNPQTTSLDQTGFCHTDSSLDAFFRE